MLDQIKVFPNVFAETDFEKAHEFSLAEKWGFQISNQEFPNRKFLIMNLDDKFFTQKLFKVVKKHIGDDYRLERVYMNGQYFGMPGAPHIDSDEPNRYTFLVYMNLDWDILLGGYTVFFDRYIDTDTKEVVINSNDHKSFYPSRNTGLLFPGNMYHYAESPSKDCCEFRLTLAYKLEKLS